ncbi:hypothetical protein [Amnibacterium sp.]|uniref:hypothetical protein n=1 Tax=Amnibacterium sp. TaxID=1872496 RepID=UPI003F7BC62F
MRRSFTILTPIAAGAVVFALAAAYPASSVHGSSATGPKVPSSFAHRALGSDFRAHWGDHDREVVLEVRDGDACPPVLERQASTGPARIEATVDRPSGPACTAHRRWWPLPLAAPPIRAKGQAVGLVVDGRWKVLLPPASDRNRGQGTVQ